MDDDAVPEREHGRGGMTRRQFATALGAASIAAAGLGWVPANAAAERPFTADPKPGRIPRPNILMILADDIG